MDWSLDSSSNDIAHYMHEENIFEFSSQQTRPEPLLNLPYDNSSSSETTTSSFEATEPPLASSKLKHFTNETQKSVQPDVLETLSENDDPCESTTHSDDSMEENQSTIENEEDLSSAHDAQIERDLLAACNGLRPIQVDDGSALKLKFDTEFLLTKETLLCLQDVETILRQNTLLNSSLQRSFIVESLLLNPKYSLVESSLMPVWIASLNTEYELECLQKLIYIFARILTPLDKTYQYANCPQKVHWHMKCYQSVQSVFVNHLFWKGLSNAMHHLLLDMKNYDKGFQEERKKVLLEKKTSLLQDTSHQDTFSQSLREINDELFDLESKRVKRYESLQSQMMCLKTLILCILRLASSEDIQFSLLVAAEVTTHGLWDVFEVEWRSFLSTDALNRSRRTPLLTASLWRVLDFYGRLLHQIPPVQLLSCTFMAIDTPMRHPSETPIPPSTLCDLAVTRRHTRFNPFLMRKRISVLQGEYTFFSKRDKQPRCAPRRRTQLETSFKSSGALRPDLYDIVLKPLCQTTQHECEETFAAAFTEEKKKLLLTHLHSFIRSGVNTCVKAWIADCIAEDESLDDYDVYKVMNLISWILHFERYFIQKRMREFSSLKKDDPLQQADILLKDVVAHALSLRSLLDTNGIFFVYKFSHTLLKKHRLAKSTDFLLKLCLRALLEQLYFGLLLTQHIFTDAAEPLKVVGRCVLEDLLKCNITSDISLILRLLKPTSHDIDLVYYTFETTFVLIHAFTKLGGSAAVSFGQGRRKINLAQLSRVTRRVELVEFLQQLADGRIIKTILKCLRNYSINSGQINQCLARLLLTILRDHGRNNSNCLVALCFQLSYFDVFAQILQDKSFKNQLHNAELVQCTQWIVNEFWDVVERNKFCIVELLFPKSEKSPNNPFTFSNPNILISVYTNYNKGLDREYLNAMHNDTNQYEDVSEWKRHYEARLQAQKNVWIPQETRLFLRLWDIKRKLPNALRLIRRSAKSKRSLREIRQHFTHLGVLEMEFTNVESNESHQSSDMGLIKAVMSFCQDDFSTLLHTQHATQFTPRGSLLSHVECVTFNILEQEASNSTLLQDTKIPLDSSMIDDVRAADDICEVMQALGAVQKDTILESTDSTLRKKAWYFLQGSLTLTLQEKVKKLKSLLNLTPKDLQESLSCLENSVSPRSFEKWSKFNIVTCLALFKTIESVFDWQDVCELKKTIVSILQTTDKISASFLHCPPKWSQNEEIHDAQILEYFSIDQPILSWQSLALPSTIASSSLASAISAGLNHLSRKRINYITQHVSPIPNTEQIALGQLVFPQHSLNPMFQDIVRFITESKHPFLKRLMESVGFQLTLLPTNNFAWVLPANYSLERIDIDLQHLNVYAMSSAHLLLNTLKQLTLVPTQHSRSSSSEKRSAECPLLIIEQLTDEACRYIAKAVYLLRSNTQKANLQEHATNEFKRIINLVTQWNSKRRPSNDQDFFLQTTGDTDEAFKEESTCIGRFKDMMEFRHCLLSILGRCDNDIFPTVWFWSKGTTTAIFQAYFKHAFVCLDAPLKILKKYAKRKILLDELCASRHFTLSPTLAVQGANVRANVAQYEYERQEMLTTKQSDSDSICTNLMNEQNSHTTYLEKEQNTFSSFIPQSRLDQDQFIESLLINASKDYEHYKTKSSKTIEEEILLGINSLSSFPQKTFF